MTLLVALSCALAGAAAYSLSIRGVVTLWAPSGVFLGALLATPRRHWPAIVLGGFLGNVVADYAYVERGLLTIAGPAANALESVTAALVVRALAGERSILGTLRGIGALTVGAAVVSNALTAIVGGALLAFAYQRPSYGFREGWLSWWVGDGLGMIVVAPAVIALVEGARRVTTPGARPRRLLESAALVGLVLLTAFVTFDRPAGFDRFAASLVFPLLIWTALRAGSGAAAAAVCAFSGVALWFSRAELGPLVDLAHSPVEQAIQVYAFLVLLAVSVLVFAATLGEREAAAARVRESERGYRSLVETAQDAILTTDAEGTILLANPALQRLVGRGPSELVGASALELVAPQDRMALLALARGAADTTDDAPPTGGEFVLRHRGGDERPVELTVGVWTVSGERRLTWIAHDLSERKRAEAQREDLQRRLAQSQRLESIGRLAGGIAHDFNNTLTVLLGNADEALTRLPHEAGARSNLEEIRKAALRSSDLVRQLLGFARRQVAAPRVTDVNAHLGEVLGLLRRLIGDAATLEWRPGEGLWPVRIDPAQLDQISTNLCANARDAAPGRGRIELTTRNVTIPAASDHPRWLAGEFVRLSVSDDGAGIAPEVLPHLFEPFFTTRASGEGVGLGLATVHGIVAQNGGFITVDSAPGRGTTFHVHLRRHVGAPDEHEPELPARRPDEPLETPPSKGGKRLLVVDDEPAILEIITTVLTRAGYSVEAVCEPQDALRRVAEDAAPVDLLVTDMMMPGLSGRELDAQLRKRHPGLKALFTSGYSADMLTDSSSLPSGAEFLQKPFTPRGLLAKVEQILSSGT